MKNTQKKHNKNEQGSVLWFILIGLVLIGLLTALLSRSGTSVDQSGDTEQQRIKVNQMLRYVKGIEAAVQQMKLRGVSENDLNFDPNAADSGNCARDECKVFHVNGGGLSYQAPPTGINDGTDWVYVGRLRVNQLGDSSGTAAASELLIMLPNVTQSYCTTINKLLGVTNPSGAPPKDSANSTPTPYFTGQFASGNFINGNELDGQPSACYDGFDSGSTPPEGTYQFYHTLIIR